MSNVLAINALCNTLTGLFRSNGAQWYRQLLSWLSTFLSDQRNYYPFQITWVSCTKTVNQTWARGQLNVLEDEDEDFHKNTTRTRTAWGHENCCPRGRGHEDEDPMPAVNSGDIQSSEQKNIWVSYIWIPESSLNSFSPLTWILTESWLGWAFLLRVYFIENVVIDLPSFCRKYRKFTYQILKMFPNRVMGCLFS